MMTADAAEAATAAAEFSSEAAMNTSQQLAGENNGQANRKRDGFDSIQDVIFESMKENQKLKTDGNLSNSNMLLDTMKDITTVANGTFASLQRWANNVEDEDNENSEDSAQSSTRAMTKSQKQSLIKDLAWPFISCGMNMNKQHQIHPRLSQMTAAATDIWKFAAGSREEDEYTIETVDTLQEENNTIRRLGSWGTINTNGTSCTTDTDLNSLDDTDTIDRVEDDDGNVIDPLLLKKAQATRGKRANKREKLVKFDYPPISSLRQCPRHDPEDLPNLFFTEHELDQIEDDRYSTMSTDDIEIVAVSSKADDSNHTSSKFSQYKSPRAKTGLHTSFSDSQPRDEPETTSDVEETGWKQPRGRNTTPYRRRHHEDNEDADFPTHESKSPSSSGRLVKGVQIYLRERSTGA